MEHEEFKKIYGEIEQKLNEKFWLIPRERAMLLIGAVTTFLAITVGTSWLAATAAVSGGTADKATKRIQNFEIEARKNATLIAEQASAGRQTEYLVNMAHLAKAIDNAYLHYQQEFVPKQTDGRLKNVNQALGDDYTNDVMPAAKFFKRVAGSPNN